VIPDSAQNAALDATDFAPLALYASSGVIALIFLLGGD
jgi:hypothetical protein